MYLFRGIRYGAALQYPFALDEPLTQTLSIVTQTRSKSVNFMTADTNPCRSPLYFFFFFFGFIFSFVIVTTELIQFRHTRQQNRPS
jgi:hypothetical protein